MQYGRRTSKYTARNNVIIIVIGVSIKLSSSSVFNVGDTMHHALVEENKVCNGVLKRNWYNPLLFKKLSINKPAFQ